MQEDPESPGPTSAECAVVVVRRHVRARPLPCARRRERGRPDRVGVTRATPRAEAGNGNRVSGRPESAEALVRHRARHGVTR